MKTNWLYLLMVLVAMQSTIAVADLHQSPQAGQEHISFNHTDDHLTSVQADIQSGSETDLDSMTFNDCQHCCHGVACHYYLLKDNTAFLFYLATDNILAGFNPFSTRIIPPDLRPPIV